MEDSINLPFLLLLTPDTSEAALRELLHLEGVRIQQLKMLQKEGLQALVMVELQEYRLVQELYVRLTESPLVEEIL